MFDRIKTRLSSEEGFTLIELLVVIVILGILVAIAVPSYLSLRGNAQQAAAKSNVRSAIPAAEEYYQTTGNNSYSGLSTTSLATVAPGVSPNVQVAVSSTGQAYCLQDSEDNGTTYFSYIGGSPGDTGITLGSGDAFATIEAGTCNTTAGITAS